MLPETASTFPRESRAAGVHAWMPPAQARVAALPRVAVLLIVVVLFGVSGGMLWTVGINYDGLTGGAASKIHPSTYLIVALAAWAGAVCGNPIAFAANAARLRPAALLLLAAAIALVVQIVVRDRAGLAGAVDTYLAPAVLVLLLSASDPRLLREIAVVVHVLMGLNAILAIVEFVSGTLLFPYRFEGEVFATDTRSSALGGHPLVNAMIAAVYVLAILGPGGRDLRPLTRTALVLLQLAALVTFGGRSAIVVVAALGAAAAAGAGRRVLRRGRINLIAAASAIVVIAMAPVAVAVLVQAGFFDALLSRFVQDGGSANARVEMFDLFSRIPLRDLITGPDTGMVESLRRIQGLEWGIENPIIRTLLYQGAILTVVLAAAVVLFMAELVRASGPGTFLPVLAFAILLNTSESIAGKTTILAKFAVLILALYRQNEVAPAPEGLRTC